MNYFWNILISYSNFEFLALIALAAAKATLLLAFVALLCLGGRRFSAATRHLLWTSVICASLLLPFLSFINILEVPVLPEPVMAFDGAASNGTLKNGEAINIPVVRSPQTLPVLIKPEIDDPKTAGFKKTEEFLEDPFQIPNAPELQKSAQINSASFLPRFANWILAVWAAGALLFLLRLLIGLISTNLLARRSGKFEDNELTELFSALLVELNLKKSVRMLRSERTLMPVVCGILRPTVLLPAEAEIWSAERRRMVLLHELTHIARRDCLTQMLAQIACAFYWFNPFIWSAARRLRIEREQACDDYVLSIGTKPSDYAHHLLEIARSLKERSILEWSQTSTVAMARKSQLEGRLLAILSKKTGQRAMPRFVTAGLLSLICFVFFSLAVIHPTVINGQNSQISKNSSNSGIRVDEKAPSDTSSGPEDKSKLAANRIQEEEIGKQEAIADKSVNGQNSLPEDVQIDINPEIDVNITAPEVIAEQNLSVLPTPEIEPQPNPQPNPQLNSQPNPQPNTFVNVQYEQERNVQTQEKSEDFIEEMASVGYTNLSVDELIKLKNVGVTADYVRKLRSLGYNNLTTRELANMCALDVSPAYIEGLRNAGYKDLTVKELTGFKAVGVTPELISKYRNAGYGDLSARQLNEFSVHGITTDFISAMNAVGFGKLSPRDLVSMRIFDITPEFVNKSRSSFGGDLTLRQIIELKNMGIFKDKDKDKDKD